jgi:hypothetical protein
MAQTFTELSIKTAKDLGLAIRATRNSQKIRLNDLSGSTHMGRVFAREGKHGKETVALGKVIKLMAKLGVQLNVDIPESAQGFYEELQAMRLWPLGPRKSLKKTDTKYGDASECR